jgi:hypothetical protein
VEGPSINPNHTTVRCDVTNTGSYDLAGINLTVGLETNNSGDFSYYTARTHSFSLSTGDSTTVFVDVPNGGGVGTRATVVSVDMDKPK